MTFTYDEFLLLQAVHKSSMFGYPCPSDVVAKAATFIKAGIIAVKGDLAKSGMADLYITDDGKWKLLASGRILQD